MVSKVKPIRGTHDLLPQEMRLHRYVENIALSLSQRFGFSEIATPIFESAEIFQRSLGNTSDIVTKEMYTFQTKGGETVTLRPEGTAGIARALISNGLAQNIPLKFFYRGPMFRHERPQKGRHRQFQQVGIELLGIDLPAADVEVIALGHEVLSALGLAPIVKLELNSLGDAESRQNYRDVLVDYFTKHISDLSQESLNRLARNPLRILDSKDPNDRKITSKAPAYSDYLTEKAINFFEVVKEGLNNLGIDFELNPRLVRGLDYYCHTAFEFTTEALGAQGTILAGGRYDGLVAKMGGPHIAGVGWAAGVERLSMLLAEPPPPERPIVLIPASDEFVMLVAKLAHELRLAGCFVEMDYKGSLKKRLKHANKIGASFAVIIGEDEARDQAAIIRNLDTGQQHRVPFGALTQDLKSEGVIFS